MVNSENTWGVFQSDLILRSAIIAAIKDIRRNPYLLDYVFAQLPQDDLTKDEYGAKVIQRAKEWFLKTEIPVYLNTRIGEIKLPCIAIELVSSNEDDRTLGDVHYVPYEGVDLKWENLVEPFTPLSFDSATGQVELPEEVAENVVVVEGQFLIGRDGVPREILEISPTTNFVTIAPGSADLTDSVIRGAQPTFIAELESAAFKETYKIGCFADSENDHLIFLHTILVFILLRYKQHLLEIRGFERSTFSSTDFVQSPISQVQSIFSRYIMLTGVVRHYWPKSILQKIENVVVEPTFENEEGDVQVNWSDESVVFID